MAVTAVTTTMAGAINYTVVTDTSADWPSVANSTYFYDKATKLVYFKNSGGAVLEIFSAGGLTYFTEAQSIAAPNATVPVDSLTAVSAATNADVAILPKGSGAILADIPDNTTAGGNKRGQFATDLQGGTRIIADQVASGDYSVISGGVSNKASGAASFCGGGYYNQSTNSHSVVSGGNQNVASGDKSTIAGGSNNTASGGFSAVVGGQGNSASAFSAFVPGGYGNVASNNYTMAVGHFNTSSGSDSGTFGKFNISSGPSSYAIGQYANTNSINNRISIASGAFAAAGDCQTSKFILKVLTTSDTATDITTNGTGYSNGSNNYILLSNQSAYGFTGTIVAKESGSINVAMWKVEGLITRGANAASTVLTTSTITLVSNAPAWGTPTLVADTTIGCLRVQVTGAAATNIRWTANIETTEVIYA